MWMGGYSWLDRGCDGFWCSGKRHAAVGYFQSGAGFDIGVGWMTLFAPFEGGNGGDRARRIVDG